MSNASTPDVPARPADTRYLSFDFWRGVACLMLLCYHSIFYADRAWSMHDRSTWTAGSIAIRVIGWLWIGVPMFFVVSGYCIAGSIDSLRRKPTSIREYFARRIRRIYPPLWIMLGIAITFTGLMSLFPALATKCEQLPRVTEYSIGTWIGNFTASEAWLHRLTGATEATYVMPNSWTLCYEEQFYAIAGLILVCGAKRLFSAAALVTVLTLVARHVFRAMGIDTHGFFIDGHWLLFAAGILVYHTVNYGSTKHKVAALGVLAASMVYGVLDRRMQTDHFQRHLDEYIFISSIFASALIVFRKWDRWLAELRVAKPIAACGRMSYSIYLTHYLLVVVLSCSLAMAGISTDGWVALLVVPFCIVAAMPPAALFHKYVEKRFMNAPAAKSKPSSNINSQPPVVRMAGVGASA